MNVRFMVYGKYAEYDMYIVVLNVIANQGFTCTIMIPIVFNLQEYQAPFTKEK